MTNEPQYGTYEHAETLAHKLDAQDARKFRRVPVLVHNRAESLKLLTNPKLSLNRGARQTLHTARSHKLTLVTPGPEAKLFPVKFALKLTTLKLTQLVRRQKKFARMASTAKHVLAKMRPGYSRLRSAVEGQQEAALNCFKQVCAEIKARALACEGKLAEAV